LLYLQAPQMTGGHKLRPHHITFPETPFKVPVSCFFFGRSGHYAYLLTIGAYCNICINCIVDPAFLPALSAMRYKAIRFPFHLLLVLSLLFSAAEVSRVGLFTAASFAENDCGNLLCTCAVSCGCGNPESPAGQNAADRVENGAGIPQLYSVASEKSDNSCCPANKDNSSDNNLQHSTHAGEQASLCACGKQLPGDDDSGLIKPLEKTVFLSATPMFRSPDFYVLKYSRLYLSHPAFPDEVFHPPKSV
jgi:hypothetical protein